MARPSNKLDLALLASGRALFPTTGCAGLSLRALADHAGVNVGMFHYHFKTKDQFLRTLLQGMYEEMFASLQAEAGHAGPAIARLRAALLAFAGFARANRRVLARIWTDAVAGEKVAHEFFRDNLPRHVGLLTGLLEQARREGALRDLPAVQQFAFLMGALVMPVIFAAALVDAGVPPLPLRLAFGAQVMTDAALEQRVDLALAALRAEIVEQPKRGLRMGARA